MQESEKFLHKNLLNEAKISLRHAILSFPESASADKAVLLHAEALRESGEYGNAVAELERFLSDRTNSPLDANAVLLEAEIAAEQKQYPKAELLFAKTVEFAEKDLNMRHDLAYADIASIALYWQGISLAQEGKFEEAKEHLIGCYERFPINPLADDALFTLGQIAESDKNNAKAVEYYQRISTFYGKRNLVVAARIRAAHNFLALRKGNSALAEVEGGNATLKAIKADSTHQIFEAQSFAEFAPEQLLYLRGESYNQIGKYDLGLESFENFLTYYQKSPLVNRAHLGAGFSWLNLERNDSALVQYDAIIASEGADANVLAAAHLYRAIALKRDGKRDDAKRELVGLTLQQDFPLLGEAFLELGQMQYENEKFADAVKSLERATREKTPILTQIKANILLGEAALEQKEFNKSAKAFAKAESLLKSKEGKEIPNQQTLLSEAMFKQGIAHVGAKQGGDAIATLNAFMAEFPKDSRVDEARFWLAESFYAADLMKNAAESYKYIIRNLPQSPHVEESLYGLGWVQFRTRDFSEAAATFTRLLREFPDTKYALDVLTRKGDGHFLTKQYHAAADAYRQAVRRDPHSEQGEYCQYQLGLSLYRSGESEEAVNEMRTFTKSYPKSSLADNAWYLIGTIRFEQKNYPEAIRELNAMTEKYPKSELAARAFYAIGDAYYNAGNYAEALTAYQKVTDSYPNSPYSVEALNGVQYCLVAMGKEDEAGLVAEKFIAANPTSPAAEEVKFGKANLFYNGKKYSNAITEYEDFLKKYSDSEKRPEALYWLGKSHASAGDLAKATQTFDELRTKYPRSSFASQAALELALAQIERNEPDKADSLLTVVQKTYPDSAVAIRAGFEQVYLRQTRGDTARALAGYISLAENHKGTEYGDRSRFWAAMYFREHNQNDSARTHFTEIAKRNDELGAEAQFRIGELWLREKNYQKAEEAFLRNKSNFSQYEDWYTLSLINLGECYENLDKKDEAKEMYRVVVGLRGQDDFGKTASTRLERLEK